MDAKQYLDQLEAIDVKIQIDKYCWKDKQMRSVLGESFDQKLISNAKAYKKAKVDIYNQIKGLPDKAHRVILYHVYVKKMTLKEVAANTGKSYKWVLMKHDEALKVFEEKYSPLEYLT